MILALLLALALPPAPDHFVTDTAHALSSGETAKLESRLAAYHKSSGHQVIVYVAPSTDGEPLESYTSQAGHAWKIGNKGKDNGAILFLFTKDRAVRIEVGYGLEGQLTDAQSHRIVSDDIVPKLKSGNIDSAVESGVDGMLATLDGDKSDETSSSASSSQRSSSSSKTPWFGIILLVLAVAFVVAVIASIAGLIAMIFKGPQAFWPTFWGTIRVVFIIMELFGSRRGSRGSSGGSRSDMNAGGGDFGGGGSSGRY